MIIGEDMKVDYPISPEDIVDQEEIKMKKIEDWPEPEPVTKQAHIKYQIPWCCGGKMAPQYTYKGGDGCLYREFVCFNCRNKETVKITEVVSK